MTTIGGGIMQHGTHGMDGDGTTGDGIHGMVQTGDGVGTHGMVQVGDGIIGDGITIGMVVTGVGIIGVEMASTETIITTTTHMETEEEVQLMEDLKETHLEIIEETTIPLVEALRLPVPEEQITYQLEHQQHETTQ